MKKLLLTRIISNKGYIDPSVMTITIQAIAGVAIAVGAFIGIRVRKAKKKIAEKMGVDENRNKEVEGDDIVFVDNSTHITIQNSTVSVDTTNNTTNNITVPADISSEKAETEESDA